MRILFLTNLLPYPLDSGGKIKSYTTLRALKDGGHEIELLCFTETDGSEQYEENLKDVCPSICQIPFKITTAINKRYMVKTAAKSLASRYPFSVYKHLSRELLFELEKRKQESYDCVYFDHVQMFVYFDAVRKQCKDIKIILDAHECEYVIMARRYGAAPNLFVKLFLKAETVKMKKFEKYAIENADSVITLSQEDKDMLLSLTDKQVKTAIIPIGMKMPLGYFDRKFDDLTSPRILFVGTLSWAPNHDGLIWFLKNVYPELMKDYGDFELYVIGKYPGKELTEVYGKYGNITVTGYVPSVEPYYRSCDFMVVPLFAGSGQRVKIIEAFSYGLPVVSTSVGAEGLSYEDGKNLLIADDVSGFIRQMERMKEGELRRALSENSRKTFTANYSMGAVKEKINAVVIS